MNERFTNIPAAPEGLPLTNIDKIHAQFPGVVLGNELHVFYQKYSNRHDSLETGVLRGGKLEEVTEISGQGEVLYPKAIVYHGAVWYCWSETDNRQWAIRVRCLQNGTWGEPITVEKEEAVFYPSFYIHRDELYLLWTRQGRDCAQAVTCRISQNGAGEKEVLSLTKEAYRAKACEGGDGNLYLTYDAFEEGAYQAVARVKTSAGWSGEVRLNDGAEWVCDPTVIPDENGATVCWYTFGDSAAYGIYYTDLSAEGAALCAGPQQTVTQNVGWYLNLSAASDGKGLQIITYSWSKNTIQVRYRRGHGPWSRPASMSYEDIHCAMYPSALIDEDGTICLVWQFAHRNGHFGRNAQTVLTRFTAEDIDLRTDAEASSEETNFFTRPIPEKKSLDKRTDAEKEAWLKKNGYHEKLLFGDIHGQSGVSDGMGMIDQYYRRSLVTAHLDFSCLTDHDCYPDWTTQSEWELMRTTARLMNTDDKLTCLLSYEWTPNEYQYDFGHKNVYYRDDEGELFRSGDLSGITPTALYDSIRKYGAMCIPHHPAADWDLVSAATDWSFHDDEVQRLVEIFSRHAPYEDYESESKYTKNIKKMPGHSVQDALEKGYRMGFTAGSDSHQMEHGIEGGIAAVFTPTHNRAGLFDAMYSRFTYGTTGARILVSLKAEGSRMGTEITLTSGKKVHFALSVLGTKTIKVELLRNNRVIKTWEPGSDALDAVYEDEGRTGADWYYLRVTQPDGHMAWSSPIWVDRI